MLNLPTLKYIFLIGSLLLINNHSAVAQITPDNTLGAESSRVVPNGAIDKIDGGALRDKNLFHSFKEFNIKNGQSVYFNNPSGIENILTRVTGKNASNIFGTLGVDGAANLFLINPNGIVFGENARLDLGGSFVGTTASGLQFGEQGDFSATNPQAPGLLTVNPNALFFNQLQGNAGIINKSQASAGINPNGIEITGLRVPNGKSLLLIGGDINLDGGRLRAYEGNIELASIASPESIGLDISGNTFNLDIPTDVERGDISLANESYISVFGAGEGNLIINARNLEISNSFIFAGIGENSDNSDAQAGNINLNATESILLKDGAGIGNSVYSQGNAGNIRVKTGTLSLTNGSQLSTNVLTSGNAGNIFIEARDSVKLDGVVGIAISGIESSLLGEGIGKAGDIQIATGLLSVTDGANISTDTNGQGDAGNININARDKVTISGFDTSSGLNSKVSTTGTSKSVGNGGDVRINTNELLLKNGGSIETFNSGKGNAGNIFLDVSNTITFDGKGSDIFPLPSSANTFVFNGDAGNIEVNTGSLFLKNGGYIDAIAFSEENSNDIANAGNITINARDSIKLDGEFSGLSTSLVRGTGKGGNIQITTASLSLTDTAELNAATYGQGDAGDIEITTDSLFVSNTSYLGTYTSGQGDAGNIRINASNNVTFDNNSFASSSVYSEAIGNGGDIKITAGSFSISSDSLLETSTFDRGDAGNITINANTFSAANGGQISTSTFSDGNAGNIVLNVKDKVTLSGTGETQRSGLFAETLPESTGKGGSIFIDPRLVIIENGAGVSVASLGTGDAGDISLQADNLQLNNGFISAITNSTQGGNLNLQLGELLLLRNNSQISTTAGFAQAGGNGGNITIDSPFIVALPKENSDITANAFAGNGGNINIISQGIFGITPRSQLTSQSDITASSETGIQGTINITNPEVDPNQGVIELPEGLVDKSNQIAQICPQGVNAAKRLSEFYITGRGSLPPSPFKPLTGRVNRTSLATLDEDMSIEEDKVIRSDRKIDFESKEIVEAQGFMKNADGEIYLVAQVPSSNPSSNAVASACSF